MEKHTSVNGLSLIMTVLTVILLSVSSTAYAQQYKKEKKIPDYKSIPSSSFLTINAEYLGGYRPDQFFNPQVPAFGFKLGTMRNVGWFVSAMTNFNFKGTFVTCDPADIVTESTSSSYFDALMGITLRYWRPMSFHLGLGYTYRSFNNETIYGQWAHTPGNTSQGPIATAGLMFHFGGFVISAEMVGGYNLQGIRQANYRVDKTRFTFGAKAGLGICIPYKYRDEYMPRTRQSVAVMPQPTIYEPAPVMTAPVATVPQPSVAPKAEEKSAPATECTTKCAPQPAPTLTIVTHPVSQLSQGWITICGEVAEEGDEPVIERGICWSTSQYPSITGPHTSDGSGPGYFTTVISDLQPETIYYFRAYAGTKSGLRYGNTVSVTLPPMKAFPQAPQYPAAPMQPQVPNQPVMQAPPAVPMQPQVPNQPTMQTQPAVPMPPVAPQPPMPTPQQPTVNQQVPQQPTTEQPAPQQPTTDQPTPQQPTTEQPAPQQPTTEQPAPQQPSEEQSVPQQPNTEQPAPQQSTEEQPVPQQPTIQQTTPPTPTPTPSENEE